MTAKSDLELCEYVAH